MSESFDSPLSQGIDGSTLERDTLELEQETVEILTNDDGTFSFAHPRNLDTLQSDFSLNRHRIDGSTLHTIFRDRPLDDRIIGVTETEGDIVGVQLPILRDALAFAVGNDMTDTDLLFCPPDGFYPTAIGVKAPSPEVVNRFNKQMEADISESTGVLVVIPPYRVDSDFVEGSQRFDGVRVLEIESDDTDDGETATTSPDPNQDDLPTLSLSRIIAWFGGGISLLSALSIAYQMGWQSTAQVTWGDASVVFLLAGAGAISTPNTRPQVEQIIGYKLSRGMVVVLVLLLWFLAGVMLI